MNFFEQELRRLFDGGEIISSPGFAGRACLGTLGKDLRVRAQFVTTGYADHYDALKITVMNRTDGPVDTLVLKLKDLLGKKPVPGNPNFREGVSPHIWDDYGKLEWYAYPPADADYETIRQAAGQYLSAFRDRQQERIQDGPKLVYICAPLRGDMEKNIDFARQKAQEVFLSGDIPVCPHLMFPPIADPENPVQDQAAWERCKRLVESCQEVHVYGPTITEGMQVEIQRAQKQGIPVSFEREPPQRIRPRKRSAQKGGPER